MISTKISVITVCFNAAGTIERCINSVLAQKYSGLEYIIVDGGSTDGTFEILQRYVPYISKLLCEPDKGVYDAMNKGIKLATGDIIGMLNADDCFAGADVLNNMAGTFKTNNYDILYGDLDFIDKTGKIVRKWRAGNYRPGSFNYGWMPPHPTFYARKALFDRFGLYSLDYGSAADYELMLRFMHGQGLSVYYLSQVMVNMQTGGVSNSSINNRIAAWRNDLKAMRQNGLKWPELSLLLKPLRKIQQYLVW